MRPDIQTCDDEEQQEKMQAVRQAYNSVARRIGAPYAERDGYVQVPTSYGATDAPAAAAGSSSAGAGEQAQQQQQRQATKETPSKIEPKVWLAAERTYLNWLRVAILLSTFALTLFNSAGADDKLGKGMGLVYAVIAVLMLGYAYFMHEKRRRWIASKHGGDMGTSRLFSPASLPTLTGMRRRPQGPHLPLRRAFRRRPRQLHPARQPAVRR